MISIGKLKEYRIQAGLTQLELANMIEVTPRYIAFLEAGDRKPSLETAEKIANVFKTTVDDIFLTKKCTKCS